MRIKIMKFTHKLISTIALTACLSIAETNLAQAAVFSFDKAIWRSNLNTLIYQGHGTPGAIVEAYLPRTIQPQGRARVARNGIWRFSVSNPKKVPCAIRVESGSYSAFRHIAHAPGSCSTSGSNNSSPANHPPSISGTPKTRITAGHAYRFRATARDADDDRLTFSIANRPSWASFNTQNGTLTGTPTRADAGRYSNIIIRVSDGKATTSLNPLNLTVTTPSPAPTPTTGSFSFRWVAPTTRTNGQYLHMREIAGYRVYMGSTANSLQPVLDLEDNDLDHYTMREQRLGTYYIALTAYDINGSESLRSNVVRKRAQ
jgi:hypothetical protein